MANFRRTTEQGSGLLWPSSIRGVLDTISGVISTGAGYGAGKLEVNMYDGATSSIESADPFASMNLFVDGTSTGDRTVNQYISSGSVWVALTGSGAVFGSLR